MTILYHGTNSSAINSDFNMTNCINGLGFYLTNDIDVARSYGKFIHAFDMNYDEIGVADRMVVRPIDQRYTEDMSLYTECVDGGMEYVITNQSDLDYLNLDICGDIV
jgi:hypothetical protein